MPPTASISRIGKRSLRGLALVVIGLCSLCVSVNAQDSQSDSFLTSFPENESYRLAVIGDDFGYALHAGMKAELSNHARVTVAPQVLSLAGIMSRGFDNKTEAFAQRITAEPMDAAVVMIGYWDRVSLRSSTGRRVRVASKEWLAEYTRRVSHLMQIIKAKTKSVYWVGLPILRRKGSNWQSQQMNEVQRQQAYRHGFRFIDSYTVFSENDTYSAYGPDLDGKIRLLRLRDGIGFTDAGRQKLAHFVRQQLNRDIADARASRKVALLGAPEEQARVNPGNANKSPAPSSPVGNVASGALSADKLAQRPRALQGVRDQKADNSTITVSVAAPDGGTEKRVINIVRPPLPANVISLMARRQSSSQMGDVLVEQIGGGLTLMSSVTSASKKARRGRLAPTQAPYFRVLVRGERLTPKPGRADDISWSGGEKSSAASGRWGRTTDSGG